MLPVKAPLLRDVLEEHLEELAFLWELRREGASSPEQTRAGLSRLEARVEAHADGLALARGELLDLVSPGLSSDEPAVAFASALALLRAGRGGGAVVLEAFRASTGGAREGLAEALAHGESRETREGLAECAASPDAGLAVAAATALAMKRLPGVPDRAVERFVADVDPAVRAAGWRLAALLAEAPRIEALRRGLDDADERAALEAARAGAWFAAPAALEACRARTAAGAPPAEEWLRLLAVLAAPADVSVVIAAAQDGRGAGAAGPRALGALGHPRGVAALLSMMEDGDPARAAAAGRAFEKVTGLDAAGEARAVEAASGPEAEADDEPDGDVRPDAAAARSAWEAARGGFSRGERWCRGFDASAGGPGELPAELDMESLRELRLRGRFTGSWKGDAASVLRMAPSEG